jgi:YHS domain-containing protein
MTELQTPIYGVNGVNSVSGSRIDPVCGMRVTPARKNLVAVYEGRTYWFCAQACLSAFDANPLKYLAPKSVKRKGWFGRYLERLARVNEREFGAGGLKCH